MRVLLVEDDPTIGNAVRDHAASQGHAVDWATTIAQADAFSDVVDSDLILLDLQLPDGSGVAFLKRLRGRRNMTPVIVLTARDQISDRIEGLNAGADDYLVKPFDLGELAARIHAVARRYGQRTTPIIQLGDVEVEPAERRLTGPHGAIDLSGREWAVLDCLLRHPGTIVPKSRIEDALYALGSEVQSNTVEVYVSRLRKKLGSSHVVTVRGLGYRMDVA
ncbi:response regulator transcription factor [Tianweitania sp. BSSL-BM11]|uniref:Response regulator transcription factor n=1 Tax=Tianweitania aestuarii TaxID=2814886 RepID=A0ABS5RR90_9HYPH|nr:response regulator transcription factor [Tianweitania aestuarii]